MPNIGLLSNKVKVVGPSDAASDRYNYLDLKNAEPNFGVPVSDNGILASMAAGTRKFLYPSSGLAIDGSGNITVDITLSDITDVNTAGILTNQLIRFDGTAFVPTTMTEDSTGDVSVSSTLTVETAIDLKDIQTSTVSEVSYSTTSASSITSFNGSDYSSGKLIVQVKDNVTSEIQVCQISVVHNTSTASTTEYSNLFTGLNPLATFSAAIRGGNVHIDATAASTNSTTYKVLKTLIKF